MERCPVCHGEVEEEEAMANSNTVYYFGRLYVLKHRECKEKFLREPERYIQPRRWAVGSGAREH